MSRSFFFKFFNCFLIVSFFLLTSGVCSALAETQEKSGPLGDMTSRGELKVEVREGVWKDVEPSYFPIFQGMKIKTGKGAAVVSLANRSQIELRGNTVLSFEQKDQLRISQGRVDFRISSGDSLIFKVGSALILKSTSMQTDARPLPAPSKVEDALGSIQVHSNGSVTVHTNHGKLFVLNQDRKVLAAISAKESLTIPAPLLDKPVEKAPGIKMAQAGEIVAPTEDTNVLGLPAWAWGVGAAVVGVAGIAAVAGGGGGGGGGGSACP